MSCFGTLCLLALFFLNSCEYELKSDNFNELAKPDTTRMIELTLDPNDTYYLFTVATAIHFDLNTFGLKIYNVELFMDDVSIFKGDVPVGIFVINPGNYTPGNKTLTLVVTTNTNTKSLADLTGFEGLVFIKKWDVYVDGTAPDPIKIDRIFNDNGLLKLEWKPYVRPNFQKYRVWVHYSPLNYPDYDYMIAEIADRYQNYFYDSSFVGGTPRYWIEVMASNLNTASEAIRYEYQAPKLQSQWQRGDSTLFSWKKHAFYRALASYSLTTSGSYPYNQIKIFSSSNPNDTLFLMKKMRFGQALDYTLTCNARKSIIPRLGINSVSDKINISIGGIIPKSQSSNEVYDKPVLYLSYYSTVTKISFPSGVPLMQFNPGYAWSVAPDDGLIFTWNGDFLIEHDAGTFNPLKTIGYSWPGIPAASTVSLKNTSIAWLDDGLGLYDFTNERYVFSGKNAGLDGAVISPDGKYTFTQQYLYNNTLAVIVCQVTDTGLVEKWRVTSSGFGAVKWINEDYSKLLIKTGNAIRIYNPENQAILYKVDVNNASFCGIDTESGRIAVWDVVPNTDDKNKLYLYDYKNGALIREINLAPRFDNLLLYRSHLISGEGFCLDISNY